MTEPSAPTAGGPVAEALDLPTLAEVLDALEDGHPGPLRAHLEHHLGDAVSLAEWDQLESAAWWNSDDDAAPASTEGAPKGDQLPRLLRLAASQPGVAPLVLLHARHGLAKAWEQAWGLDELREHAQSVADAWRDLDVELTGADEAAGGLVRALVEVLGAGMRVENTSTTSDLRCWSDRAEQAAEVAASSTSTPTSPGSSPPCQRCSRRGTRSWRTSAPRPPRCWVGRARTPPRTRSGRCRTSWSGGRATSRPTRRGCAPPCSS